jgi:prepilin-type N-terminal cleavage/methylation domain-containing protein
MTTKAAQSNTRPAFSIIELLVSIAIIALLIGILFPALSGAIGSARSVRCQANLRSLVTGLQMYQEDNDGVLPWVIVIPQTIDDPEPYLSLTSYLDATLPQGILGEDVSKVDPFACPSDRLFAPLTGFSYSYMPAAFMQVTGEHPDNLPDWRRLSKPYEGTNAPPVLQDFQRFHINQEKWSTHQNPDQTGRNLAHLDGSVSKGGIE